MREGETCRQETSAASFLAAFCAFRELPALNATLLLLSG